MRRNHLTASLVALIVLASIEVASIGLAQGPEDRPQRRGRGSAQSAPTVENIVSRMMAFDKNKDGKLTKDEITDPRLVRLFEKADANHDGIVTREELTALATKMMAEVGQSRGGFGGPGGPGDNDGPGGGPGGGDDGPGGFGPPPGFGGGFGPGGPRRPHPGQLLPPHVEDSLSLTSEQKAKIAVLEKEVMGKLTKILTDKQNATLKTLGPPEGNGPPPPPPDE